MNRLMLVRHATTRDTRRAAFPATTGARAITGCADLDGPGREVAAALRRHLPAADRCWSSFAVRALATAEAAGYQPVVLAELAEADFGSWAGCLPADVDQDGLAAWYADPDAAPHGGESLSDVRRRAVAVLARAAAEPGTTVAFTHGGLIKAAFLEALDLPPALLWRLDVHPGGVTELHWRSDTWRLTRLNWTPWLTRPREAAA